MHCAFIDKGCIHVPPRLHGVILTPCMNHRHINLSDLAVERLRRAHVARCLGAQLLWLAPRYLTSPWECSSHGRNEWPSQPSQRPCKLTPIKRTFFCAAVWRQHSQLSLRLLCESESFERLNAASLPGDVSDPPQANGRRSACSYGLARMLTDEPSGSVGLEVYLHAGNYGKQSNSGFGEPVVGNDSFPPPLFFKSPHPGPGVCLRTQDELFGLLLETSLC